MTFDSPGYPLKFIQRRQITDGTAHLFTFIFKFFSSKTKYHYIVNADYHDGDVFAVKFYCKKDKRSLNKYNKIVNKGDVGNILISCAKVVPQLLADYPNASFGFAGARTIDPLTKKVEPYSNNQRYRTYKGVISKKFGLVTFAHYEYEDISCYLLVNRNCKNVEIKERELIDMFTQTYNTLLDV